MKDPAMILRGNAYADGHPDIPVLRQRLRPQRVNLEPGRHDRGFTLYVRHLLQNTLTNEECDKDRKKGGADVYIFSFHIFCMEMNRAFSTQRVKGSKGQRQKKECKLTSVFVPLLH